LAAVSRRPARRWASSPGTTMVKAGAVLSTPWSTGEDAAEKLGKTPPRRAGSIPNVSTGRRDKAGVISSLHGFVK